MPDPITESTRPRLATPKHRDLIYDVGLHLGEDTGFYLKKGFRVVAFEANPELAARCRQRFAAELSAGRLTLVEGAIVERDTMAADGKTVPFYVAGSSLAGSVRQDWHGGAEAGAAATAIAVRPVDFADALQEHGIPYYLKIDIEGMDTVCLRALRRFALRPDYVSLESSRHSFASIRSEVSLLADLGYEGFQAVEQSGISAFQSPPHPAREGNYVETKFEAGSSGLFGRELAGPWESSQGVLRRFRFVWLGYVLFGHHGILYRVPTRVGSLLRRSVRRRLESVTKGAVPGWYDIHARLGQPVD